jgi:hypothetical protein
MSTYYEYQDVMVMIAHKLMKMDGWKVYGYHADESDSMTDYYSPAYWGGIAEKNGYILVVNNSYVREPEEIRKYNYSGFTYDRSITEKIQKLEQMTVVRGASEAEEESAKVAILKLQKKAEEDTENRNKYVVVGLIPGHMANPPRCNWHIEKDGIIIAKGNGILKYASVDSYYRYSHYEESMEKFKKDKKKYFEDWAQDQFMRGYYSTLEKALEAAQSRLEDMEKDSKMIADFEAFINKLDTTCGGLLGEGDGVIYEKIKVTEYKTEQKAVETTSGSVKDGQCFILKTSFNYGRYKGLVYRIHEVGEEGKKYFTAYKLNGKLTKECHGLASQNNTWYIGTSDNLTKWIDKGFIAWCELQEVKTPYEVEKVVKKTIKATKTEQKQTTYTATAEATTADINSLHFEISEDTDTRTDEKIYLVKVAEKLSREDYIKVNQYIKSLGGYYSRFKHAFLFRENPTELLNATPTEVTENIKEETTTEEPQTATETPTEEAKINYIITEDTHTKTGEKLYLVKLDKELNKADFTKVKRKFATLKGYYSSFKKAFIFKYDPTETLNTA